MAREEAKQLLPIIQAFAESKTIQYRVSPSFLQPNNRDISYVKEWSDIDEDKCDCFSCDGTIDYRIKPESKYRPFKNQEECLNEMMKHQPFGLVKDKCDNIFNIIAIFKESIKLNERDNCYSERYKQFKFIDGTPFGIKEEL